MQDPVPTFQYLVMISFSYFSCVESTMRTAYELSYKVYTLSDCIAATSTEAQEATLEHNFVLFSIPMTSTEGMEAINAPTLKS